MAYCNKHNSNVRGQGIRNIKCKICGKEESTIISDTLCYKCSIYNKLCKICGAPIKSELTNDNERAIK